MNNMSLMEDWEVLANQYNTDQATAQKFWTDYYMQEKAVYEKMLTEPVEVEKGTVAELAEKYGMDVVRFGGFLNVEVVTSACNTSADIFAVILEIHWEKSDITLWRTDLTDTFDHVFTLFHCRHQVKNCIVAHWHVVEIESKTCSFFGDHS